MEMAPNTILTGASGWFGQAFIYSFIKIYGYKNIDNLCLLTSDGRDIHHKVLDYTFRTSSLENYVTSKKIDLFVQAAFLTRDKINLYGKNEYKKINYKIIEDTKNLSDALKPSTRVLISSGAVNDENDLYGQIKSFEEKSVINCKSSTRAIFRVYGALGINTPLLDWSAISDLISSSNKFDVISLKSKTNVVRGYVSFEKLAHLILKISASNLKNREIILSAVEHSNSLNEIATIIAQIGKSKFYNDDINFKRLPNIYSADPTKFINMLKEFDIKRTSIYEDISQTMISPHLQ
jgi:hypothetical protein